MEKNGKLLLVALWLIWPVGLIWYLVSEKMKKDDFVKFHFKQWLLVIIVAFVGNIVAGLLTFILIGALLFPVIGVLTLVLFIQAMIFILQEKKQDLWLIGKYAEKFDF